MHERIAGTVVRLLACALVSFTCTAGAANPEKVLRLATNDIETLDPQQYNDEPSFKVLCAIFEGLYEIDYLSSVPKLAPLTAVALPEITDGGKTWTIKVKPGIYFTDDPGFKGGKRANSSRPTMCTASSAGSTPICGAAAHHSLTDLIVGARAVVDAATRPGANFDYDRPIEGLRALDRYTLQLKLTQPNYPDHRGHAADLCRRPRSGRCRARRHPRPACRHGSLPVEGMEARIARHPGGQSRLPAAPVSSEQRSRTGGAGAQHAGQDSAADRRDRIERDRGARHAAPRIRPRAPRLHRSARHDRRPSPGGRQAEARVRRRAASRGMSFRSRSCSPSTSTFRIRCVGGMGNDRVALRRAMAQSYDLYRLVDVVYAGQAVVANQLVPPRAAGHDPRCRAKAPRSRDRQCAARPLRLRQARSRRLSHGARRQAADIVDDAWPAAVWRAKSRRCGGGTWTPSGCASNSAKCRSRITQGTRGRKIPDLQRRLRRHGVGLLRIVRSSTARSRRRSTRRASS